MATRHRIHFAAIFPSEMYVKARSVYSYFYTTQAICELWENKGPIKNFVYIFHALFINPSKL